MPRDAQDRSDEELFAAYRRHQDSRQLAVLFRRHAKELLRLAMFLAPRASVAEDLVQATFLSAITNAHQFREGGRVMSWLCGILANHARMSCRDARRVPPAQLSQDMSSVEPIDAMMHVELRSHLDRCIANLPEPYRTVMRLHLKEGLESREIARRLELSRATVRKQTERALARLRTALPLGLAMGLVVRLSPAQIVEDAIESAQRLMPSPESVPPKRLVGRAQLLLGGALAAGLVFAVALATRVAAERGGSALPAPVATPVAAAPAVVTPRHDVVVPSPGRRMSAVVAAGLRVRTVDPAGGPRSNVGLMLIAAGSEPMAARSTAATTREALTDEAGVANFTDLVPGEYQLTLPGALAKQTLVLGAGAHESTLVLPPRSQLSGIVRDQLGRPVADAAIVVSESACRGDAGAVVGYSDAAGFFRATTDVGSGRVYARHAAYSSSTSTRIQQHLSTELVLEPSDRAIEVTVVDAVGSPVVDAYIALAPRGKRSDHLLVEHGRTDRRGRCTLHDPGPREATLVASAAGLAAAIVDLPLGESAVTIRLPAGGAIAGVVVDAAGEPLAGRAVLASIATQKDNEPVAPLTTRVAHSGPDGSFALQNLPVDREVRLMIRAAKAGVSMQRHLNQIVLAGQALTLSPGEVREVRLRVPRREQLVGRVRSLDGAAVVGWHVVAVPAEGLAMARIGRARWGRSRADGSVAIPDVIADEDYVLGLFAPDTPLNSGRVNPVMTMRVDPSRPFDVEFDPGAVTAADLRCRVLAPDGHAADCTTIELCREDFQQPMSRETGVDGSCLFRSLSPGDYRLTIHSRAYGRRVVRVTMPRDGAEVDLGAITLALPCLPTVRVCVDRHRYLPGMRVVLRHSPNSFTAARTDARGSAKLRAVPPGTAEVLVNGPGIAPTTRKVILETGHQTIDIDVVAAAVVCLEIPFEPALNPFVIDGPLAFEVRRDGELVLRDSIGRAARPGVFQFVTGLMPGSYTVRATSIWNAVGERGFEVSQGAANRVTIPLTTGSRGEEPQAREAIVASAR